MASIVRIVIYVGLRDGTFAAASHGVSLDPLSDSLEAQCSRSEGAPVVAQFTDVVRQERVAVNHRQV